MGGLHARRVQFVPLLLSLLLLLPPTAVINQIGKLDEIIRKMEATVADRLSIDGTEQFLSDGRAFLFSSIFFLRFLSFYRRVFAVLFVYLSVIRFRGLYYCILVSEENVTLVTDNVAQWRTFVRRSVITVRTKTLKTLKRVSIKKNYQTLKKARPPYYVKC